MYTPKISIILPTYNVAKFLLQSLNSIAAQTYKNLQVIIIIDGATDGSFEIAKEFCKKDNRFNVYWQENAGSGPARNNGIDRAEGDFIMFVDPDDWCKPDYVETLLRLQQENDYDIVTTSETTVFFNKKGKIKKIFPPHYPDVQLIGKQKLRTNYLTLLEKGTLQAPYGKIFKTELIKENNIRFPDLRRSQDIVFNYRYYDYAQSVLVSNYSGYMYRVLSKERAKKLSPDYYKTVDLIYSDILALHKKWNVPFSNTLASTILFGSIYPLFESDILRGQDIKYIVEDPTAKNILINARPKRLHLSLVRSLILSNHYQLASVIVKSVFYLKLLIL